jgi:hypothetical protein
MALFVRTRSSTTACSRCSAGARGDQSYAQMLADTMDSHIVAPSGAWTATPDGWLRAIVADRLEAVDGWPEFSPR